MAYVFLILSCEYTIDSYLEETWVYIMLSFNCSFLYYSLLYCTEQSFEKQRISLTWMLQEPTNTVLKRAQNQSNLRRDYLEKVQHISSFTKD